LLLCNFQIHGNLLSSGWCADKDDTAASALVCFMAQSGAELTKRNKRGATPFDLVKSDRLKDMLVFYSAQYR